MRKTAMFKYLQLLCVVFLFAGCNQNEDDPESRDPLPPAASSVPISAVDISAYPQIALSNPTFYNLEGDAQDFLDIIKASGVNTIRLKLWVDPADGHAGFEEVKQFSQTLKAKGFKTWLTLHYSDTWADPGQQITPERWHGISFAALQDSVSRYTERVVTEMRPDYIQVVTKLT